jgi:putative transposase
VLFRLAYLTVTNTFAVLRLLPMSDRDKDAEILVLRHQITVLERQLSGTRVRFTAPDRAFLAALLHRLTTEALRRMRLLVRPDTVLRRHRDLVRRRNAAPVQTEAAGPAADGAFRSNTAPAGSASWALPPTRPPPG